MLKFKKKIRRQKVNTAEMLEPVRQAFVRCAKRCEEAQGQDFENLWCDLKTLARDDYCLVIPVRPTLSAQNIGTPTQRIFVGFLVPELSQKPVDPFVY